MTTFVLGLLLGGVLTATVLWLTSGLAEPIPREARTALLVGIGVAALLRDLQVVSFAVPQRARQVPRSVFERGLRSAALQFGFELGTGARTHVTASAPYVVAAGIVLGFASLPSALAAGIGFGLGRALMPSIRALSGSKDRWDLRLRDRIGWMVPASSGACLVGMIALSGSLA